MPNDGQLYFIAVRSLERLNIQYVPNELNIQRNADIEEIKIVGRNNPKHHYSGGSTKLTLELDFYSTDANREDVIKKCRWLESLAANDGYKNPPQQVRLVFGKLFRNEVWVVNSVDYKLSDFSKPHGYLPVQAYCSIALSLDPPTNTRTQDIR
jgi:hypothetical protein